MINSRVVIDDKKYQIEVWANENFDTKIWTLGAQIWDSKGQSIGKEIEVNIPRPYMEDEIDDDLKEIYIENIIYRAMEVHAKDVIHNQGDVSESIFRKWLKDAKE